MKPLGFIAIIGLIFLFVIKCSAITLQQFTEATKLMQQVCQQKHKIPDELIEVMRTKVIPDDNKPLKCYILCLLEMSNTMKRGKYQFDASMKQIDVLVPDDLQDEYKNAGELCKTSATGTKDHCEAAFKLFICFLKEAPNFIVI